MQHNARNDSFAGLRMICLNLILDLLLQPALCLAQQQQQILCACANRRVSLSSSSGALLSADKYRHYLQGR
jgi:hypothetical protein